MIKEEDEKSRRLVNHNTKQQKNCRSYYKGCCKPVTRAVA